MEFTRGGNGRKKRRCTNPTRSAPKQEPGETKLLPPEVWNKVLLKLSSNEEDQETLHTCRFVCKSWKELVSDSTFTGDNREAESRTPFTQLKELILPFVFVSRDRNNDESLESRFGFQFPSLKRLVLQDSKGEFKNTDLFKARMEEICELIWHVVPPTVETIGVRTKRNERLGRHFAIIYKCSRSLAD
ncbi:hypothetical protein Ocin01_13311 [Orchesella cincta]|uniref:F-box domain-containing protein n=1 Tax=Orchesella cincta TaxID=48709 RepID=A0A1D2MKB1_ORCCI|nr:hypothetical protein Ocin01_13311 [Orchesella cincta]